MKTKTTHTPGPWKIFHGKAYASIEDSKGRAVCTDYIEQTGNFSADARLIAAAPDLLTHLKIAAKFYSEELKELGACDHDVNICYCDIIHQLDDINSTIAKAESQEDD